MVNKENEYEAIKDGFKEAINGSLRQQELERGFAWIYNAIYEATKDAISEAIKDGKIKIK